MRHHLTPPETRESSRRIPELEERQVAVYLNRSRDAWSGHLPGAPLVLAYTFTLHTARTVGVVDTHDRIFAMFTDQPLHPEDAEHTRAWYDSGLRPLSAGDVIALDGHFHACAAVDWQPTEL